MAQTSFTGETLGDLNMTEEHNIDTLCDAINQDLSSKRVRHFYAQLQGENNSPQEGEAVEAWLAEQIPLNVPIWVSKKTDV